MKVELLRAAGIDYDGGVRRFMGKAALYERVLQKFPKDATFARICEDYRAEDWDALLKDAHELKGMCGNMSLTSLYQASEAMVALLRACPASVKEISDAYALLEKEYLAAKAAVLAATEDA